MLIRDNEDRIYKTGLKIDYSPKELNFFDEFAKEEVQQMTCGRRHYVILSKNNHLLVSGNVFKEKP